MPTEQDTTAASDLVAQEQAAAAAPAPTAAAPTPLASGRHLPSTITHRDLGSFDAQALVQELAGSDSRVIYLDYSPIAADQRKAALLDGGIDSAYDQVRQMWAFWVAPKDVLDALIAAQQPVAAPVTATSTNTSSA